MNRSDDPASRRSLPLVFHPAYDVPMPEGHPFPMSKFRAIYEYLLSEGIAEQDQFHTPEAISREAVEAVHEAAYVASYLDGTLDERALRRIGFPWSRAVVRRTMYAAGGTLLTARLALEHGIACNTAGGTHHAFFNHGSGFCIFHDMAIAIRVLQREQRIARVLVVDLDVHQGDGTAELFANDPSVFTFSMHGATNFPRIKRTSDLDVALPDDTDDDAYLGALRSWLPRLLDDVRPDLVFYDAGVDPHRDDRFGKLALTDDGLAERDRYVLASCLATETPVAAVIGGGYDRDLDRLVQRHALLYRAANDLLRDSDRIGIIGG